MPKITNTRFNPNTPPTTEELTAEELSGDESPDLLSADAVEIGNKLAMSDAGERDMRAVVGTTAVGAAQRDLRRSEDRAAAERQRAEHDAEKGGEGITTAMRGLVGDAVDAVLEFHKIDRAASKVTERITGEVDALEREKLEAASIAHVDELIAEGWDAASRKQRVPAIVAPWMHWESHERAAGRPEGYADLARKRVAARQATERAQRVLDTAEQIDAVVREGAAEILSTAAMAADTLTEAGLAVDASAEEVLSDNEFESGVYAAWRAWRAAVTEWADLQSTRRWLAVALSAAFDPKRPLELASDNEAERVSWQGQFEGSELVGVQGSHAALQHWLANGRPAAAGVAYARETVEA